MESSPIHPLDWPARFLWFSIRSLLTMDVTPICAVVTAALAFVSTNLSAESRPAETRDPKTRFDDITQTTVAADVSVNGAGHYVYTYEINAPTTNTGYITSFLLHIGCDKDVADQEFDPALYGAVERSFSDSENFVPVAAFSPQTPLLEPGISYNNYLHFITPLLPGARIGELTVVSPMPPGDRTFRLVPDGEYRISKFDYPPDIEGYADLPYPWVEDWAVTGTTTGPACPGDEYK